ncbi:MAG: hypothetical protein WBH01_09640 [Dehalococcoidia bacterium]|jgi:hypothetical protein
MASSGSHRSGLLTAGGVLSIISGAFQVIGGGIGTALVVSAFIGRCLRPFQGVPFLPGEWSERVIFVGPILLGIVVIGLVLGIVAIVGGVSAVRRKSFGLSLAGAICALPSAILGILAIIFVALSKKEFEAEK